MLPLNQIDSDDATPKTELRPLIDSIRSLGIVHPLLVRRRGSRYALVAGRKRLAAANVLRMATVPCLVHELDDTEAEAFANADNLGGTLAAPDTTNTAVVTAVRQLVTKHLASIRTAADAVGAGAPPMGRSTFDLIKAHAWRAARLSDVLDLLTGAPPPQGRDRSVGAIVDDVVEGFAPEGRLNQFSVTSQIRDDVSSKGLNAHDVSAGLAAALFAMLPLLEQTEHPALTVKAGAGGPSSVVLEVSQSDSPVSAGFAQHFFDDDAPTIRPGGYAAVAGALAVKALAERGGGTAAFEAQPQGGCALKLTLIRRP
jgi:hypothetical protein